MDRNEFKRFFRACNPSKTIWIERPEDRDYYIDFTSVRGLDMVEQLGETISLLAPDPTCQLFTGHIGCGKSTELLRLKFELEKQGFVVVYIDTRDDLEMGDVDVTDVLLAIAQKVLDTLEQQSLDLKPGYFNELLEQCVQFLLTPIELKAEMEFNPEISFLGAKMNLGKIVAKTKDSPQVRDRLRDYLEPKTNTLLQGINGDLIQPANVQLQKQGKEGLVIIIDSLDRVDNRKRSDDKSAVEYLFITRGEQLKELKCHLVYTIPLVLMFSNEREALKQRLGGGNAPMVLPMVPVKLADGQNCEKGLELLRQAILARAFPKLSPKERRDRVTEVVDRPETLDLLCRISGGHVRNLLSLLFRCLQQSKQLPITRDRLEIAIRQERDDLMLAITELEWELLKKVSQTKKVTGEDEYQILLRSLFVFEYRTNEFGRWFDLNPLLEGAPELT
jgi:hypothetical protein